LVPPPSPHSILEQQVCYARVYVFIGVPLCVFAAQYCRWVTTGCVGVHASINVETGECVCVLPPSSLLSSLR